MSTGLLAARNRSQISCGSCSRAEGFCVPKRTFRFHRASRQALAAERKAAETNPEEIELDLDTRLCPDIQSRANLCYTSMQLSQQDDDEDDAPEPAAAPSGPAAPMASNTEEPDASDARMRILKNLLTVLIHDCQEIELNVEDIDEAPIAPEVPETWNYEIIMCAPCNCQVFGSGLSSLRASLPDLRQTT